MISTKIRLPELYHAKMTDRNLTNLTSEFVVADGIKLHLMRGGSGPAVVLLHGFPEFWYSWRQQIDALLNAGYSVFAPDLRGYNLSDKPAPRESYHLKHLVADVASVVRATGQDRAHIVGHDWGGILAWAFAGQHPELLDKLVIMNAPHMAVYRQKAQRPPQLFRSWYIGFFCIPRLSEYALSTKDYGAIRDMYQPKPAHQDAFSKDDIDKYIAAIAEPGALTAALNWYRCGMLTPGGMSLAVQARVTAPTQIIWGEQDPALDICLLDGIDEYAPNLAIHRIPDASHWVQSEASAEVNQVLLQFLQSS